MISPETNARLIRLENSHGYELDRLVNEILEKGEALGEAASVIEEKRAAGEYLTKRTLALLIGRTKSDSLYLIHKKKFFEPSDFEALVLLYKEKYPDPAIEKTLAGILYEVANKDPMEGINALIWGSILRAMSDVGSVGALPTLEALLYEKFPSVSTKISLAGAIRSNINEREAVNFSHEELSALLDEKQERHFFDLVSETIRAIKERSSTRSDFVAPTIRNENSQGPLDARGAAGLVHYPVHRHQAATGIR